MSLIDKLKRFKINNKNISEKLIEIYERLYEISNLSDIDKKIISYKLNEFVNGNSVSPILLTGKSGSGKNYLIKKIIKLAYEKRSEKLHIIPIDCSSFSRTGYVGMNQEDIYRIIEDSININLEQDRKVKFIIVLDEIDKISKEAQFELLKMLDQDYVLFDGSASSKKKSIAATLDFSEMFIIACGAFQNKPLKSKEEVINSGELIPEIVGRFSNVIRVETPKLEDVRKYLDGLGIDDNIIDKIYNIFTSSSIGFRLLITLKENINILRAFDSDFVLTEEKLNEVLNYNPEPEPRNPIEK